MAYVIMAFTVMACTGTAFIFMACVGMAYIVMAVICMACVGMAYTDTWMYGLLPPFRN